jgi:Bacterial pre-peptidase C-terminal domain/Bacterial Ig domain
MKTNITRTLIAALLITLGRTVWAQTADDLVSQGRAFLSVSNLVAANNSFAAAVALSPSHQTANVLYAATRLLVWPSQPAGSNFLDHLEVPIAGRDLYHWTAFPPRDRAGVPVAMPGINANEATSMARTNLLALVVAAEANLAKVVDPNFTLSLTSSETLGSPVTLDYGDIQLLRAWLRGAEYACYSGYAYNLDALLTDIELLFYASDQSLEGFLAEHPALLTFTTTNDLNAATLALQQGADRYFAASEVIRNRPTNVVRLFNLAPEKADEEQRFRSTLADLTNSVTHRVTLSMYPNYAIYAGSVLSGTQAPRAFLPAIRGDGFGLGTLPDLSFGGALDATDPAIVEHAVEKALARGINPVPTIAPQLSRTGSEFQFPINTLRGHGYVVEVSTNLSDWAPCGSFYSFGDGYSFTDPDAHSASRRFYRVVDQTTAMPAPSNDNFANPAQFAGLGVSSFGYISGATIEANEPMWYAAGNATAWWSWTAPVSCSAVVLTTGSTPRASAVVYTGSALTNLTLVAYPSQPFDAVAGTTYLIQVYGNAAGGGVQLTVTAAPVLTIQTPFDGLTVPAGMNVPINASAMDLDGRIIGLNCYEDGIPVASTTNSTLNITWSNMPAGIHQVMLYATDNSGLMTYSNLTVTAQPPNDNFADRIPITGAPLTVLGTNAGASTEPGEPEFAGNSVWWSWTAKSNGFVTILADLVDSYGYRRTPPLAVYTGNSISNLVTTASDDGSSDFFGASAQVSFEATAGVAYQIAVYGVWGSGGQVTLKLIPTEPPFVTITSPTEGAEFAGPTNLTVTASASDDDGYVSRVDFYDGRTFVGSVSNAPYELVLTNLQQGSSHRLVAKATDNLGVPAYSPGVGFTIDYPETELMPGVSVWGLSGARGSAAYYTVNVTTNDTTLQVSIYGGSGDCDLYLAYGYQPTLYHWDYRPYLHGNNESVTVDSPQPGEWHIMLYGYEAYNWLTLEADTW